MFGSMRLSAWKHKRDPASRGGNYPQTFHFLGGGLEKNISPPSTQPTPFQRREGSEKNFWNTAFVDLWACLFLHSVSPQQQVMFQEGGCGHKGTRLWTTKWLAFRSGRQCNSTPSSSQMCRIRWWDSGFCSLRPQLRLGLWVGRPSFKSSCPSSPEQLVLVVKNLSANPGDTRDAGSNPGSGRSPGKGNGNSLQYYCLENPMDRGARWGYIRSIGVAESDTTEQLIHTHI